MNLPGGGGEIGVRRGMEAKPDGLTVFRVPTRFLLREIMDEPFEYFDSDDAVMLGADHNAEPKIWYLRRDVATSWQEVLDRGTPILDSSAGAPSGAALAALLGYPVTVVQGYTGASQVRAAVARGELEGSYLADPRMIPLYPELVEAHAFAPIFYWDADPLESPLTMEYLNALGSEVPPYIFDVIEATEQEKTLFEVATTLPTATTFMPPGVPQEIVDVWKEVMVKTYTDPEMIQRSLDAGTSVVWIDVETIKAVMSRGSEVARDDQYKTMLKELVGEQ